MEYIISIHDLVYTNFSSNKIILIEKVNIIIDSLIDSSKKYFEIISKDIISLKYLTITFSLICDIKDIISKISYEIEDKLINLVLYIILFKDLKYMGNNEEGYLIWRSYNSIMLKIIDYCNPTNTINLFIKKLINNKENNKKYEEYCLRCIEIISNKIKKLNDTIIIPEILKEINNLFNYYDIKEKNYKDKNLAKLNIVSTIKKLISDIATFEKDKINDEFYNYLNNRDNDKTEISNNNLIKILIDCNLNKIV